ncbi:D-2-hydroxyacid dehydrogenase [Inconstantimicrobium mannanitabidum]|uniref:2-hydroxyacid dehydrogenase n=1 Tax=Inconstantimicrobium mannanitabidum TaxID=1604901 RepID=A0ACB5RDU6_9CLOT|nr:D-2-hydroxyacid dehydrogenase [Clostridium sp. TW13]GKX66931.1 2-hydroxyacid dehydrogenase [Clostridium sp. TW13]
MKITMLDYKTLGDDVDLSPLKNLNYDFKIYDLTSKEQVIERSQSSEVIIINKILITEDILKQCKNLKLICLTATGTNNVDLAAAKKYGVAVCNVAGYSTDSVTQHTFALLFYVLEHLKYYDEYVINGGYTGSSTFTHLSKPFWELNNKTFGIIGLGQIGKKVAAVAKAFGCNIIYHSTSGKNSNNEYKHVSLEELLKTSDIVSIHAPLNKNTENLMDYEKLSLMKKSAIILNTGRGGIINEADLCKIIDEDKIFGAGIDVISKEPIDPKSPYLTVKNRDKLIITPHIAWATIEARNRVISEVAENIRAFKNGEYRNRVD